MLSTCLFDWAYYYCYRLKLTGIGPNAHGFRTQSDGTNVEYFNEPPDGSNYPSTTSNFAFFSDGDTIIKQCSLLVCLVVIITIVIG